MAQNDVGGESVQSQSSAKRTRQDAITPDGPEKAPNGACQDSLPAAFIETDDLDERQSKKAKVQNQHATESHDTVRSSPESSQQTPSSRNKASPPSPASRSSTASPTAAVDKQIDADNRPITHLPAAITDESQPESGSDPHINPMPEPSSPLGVSDDSDRLDSEDSANDYDDDQDEDEDDDDDEVTREQKWLAMGGLTKVGDSYSSVAVVNGKLTTIYHHFPEASKSVLEELQHHTLHMKRDVIALGCERAWNGGFLPSLDYLTAKKTLEEVEAEFEKIKWHVDHSRIGGSDEER